MINRRCRQAHGNVGPATVLFRCDTGGMTSDRVSEAAEVTAFWRELGLPGLIDVHVHFMPATVLAKVWAFFSEGQGGRPWSVAYPLPEDERLELLRAFGMRRFGALLYPHKPDMAVWLNSWAAQFAAKAPDALHTATFFPEAGAREYVASAIEAGARLFKAHLQVGRYDPRDELLDPVWGLLAEAGVPVVMHCGSEPIPGPFTGPGPLSEVLARHPRLTIVVAHMGSPEYGDFLDLADRYPGVYFDTTMAFCDFVDWFRPFPRDLMPRVAALGDRIVLGTDFPNISYRYVNQLHALAKLELGDDWLRAVCYYNPLRLVLGSGARACAQS